MQSIDDFIFALVCMISKHGDPTEAEVKTMEAEFGRLKQDKMDAEAETQIETQIEDDDDLPLIPPPEIADTQMLIDDDDYGDDDSQIPVDITMGQVDDFLNGKETATSTKPIAKTKPPPRPSPKKTGTGSRKVIAKKTSTAGSNGMGKKGRLTE